MENKIKFSHYYPKMREAEEKHAVLLEVFIVDDVQQLSKDFVVYDTFFEEYDDVRNCGFNYPLPRDCRLLVLLFKKINGVVFTTIRRWTKEKEGFYLEKRGKMFKIEIKNE